MSKPVDALAREHTARAIEVIAEVINDPFAENKDRLNAANAMLDRGHGKPLTATISLPSTQAHRALLAAMSDEDLMSAIQGTVLPRLNPIDAQFTEIANSTDPLLG